MPDAGAILAGEVRSLWQQLEETPVTGHKLRTITVPLTTPDGPVLLGRAVDGRRILIPLPADMHRTFKHDRRGSALRLLVRSVETDAGYQWHADLACLRPELNEVFVTFAVDVLARIAHDPTDAVRALRRAMNDWRSLFASGERMLGIPQMVGLFGELLVLERLLERDPDATGLWRGPFQEPHDFVAGERAVEVKTSLVDTGNRFTVHGLQQLTPPPGGTLLLAHLRLTSTVDQGRSVPELVERCEALGGTGLTGMLALIRYRREHEDAYQRLSFEVHHETWHPVDDAFPRITPQSFLDGAVPAGVDNVQYEVDVTGLELVGAGDSAIEQYLDAMTAPA